MSQTKQAPRKNGTPVQLSETVEWVRVLDGRLHTPPEYQRVLKEAKVAKILAAPWDVNIARTILLNRRPDGTLAVVDGQHRLEAAKRQGIDGIAATIMQIPVSEEARIFALIHSTGSAPSALEMWRAERHYCETVQAIEGILEDEGFHIASGKGKNPKAVTAVQSLKRVWKRWGQNGLRQSLRLIAKCWTGDPSATEGKVLWGVADFIGRCGDVVKMRDLEARLAKTEVSVVIRNAKPFIEAFNYAGHLGISRSIAGVYNQGRKSSTQINVKKLYPQEGNETETDGGGDE